VKVLIVTARFPEPGMKGDQIRSRQLVELLAADHEVTVLTAARPSSAAVARELEALADVIAVPVGRPGRTIGALSALTRGLPAQVGWMTPPKVLRALDRAVANNDVVIVSTIRCLPRPLAAPTVLDHIDTLSSNMRQRAELERRSLLRAAALVEARLLFRHERRAAHWVAAQTVVSPIDAAALPQIPLPVVIGMVLELEPLETTVLRDIDVILTGDMRYPPNRDGAEWLVREIVPALRRRRADVRVVVAGRAADAQISLEGIEVLSDVPDIGDLLRRARVAVVPLRSGTGEPIKLLEAAGAGAAPVATPWVARAVGIDVDTASDAESFAAAIDRLLSDETTRAERVAASRRGLESRTAAVVRAALVQLLAEAAAKG
jgi:glycosyltransferase involved in cell wall biosynthesis